jgi:Ribbon-helix-helix protein
MKKVELKTARLTVLLDPAKKDAFERLCDQLDLTPSQVIRKFMRDFLVEHGVTWQPSGDDLLFSTDSEASR